MGLPSSDDAGDEHIARIADYYDANTRRFLRFGQNSGGGALHRGIWMSESATTAEAVDTVNRLVLDRLRDHVPAGGRVLDLGCGVGATMVRLARELDASMTGVTISRVQADLAEKRFAAEGLAERCRIVCADFAELPAEPRYDAMVAIESIVHSPSPAELIPALAARLQPGGRIILSDDWLTDKDRGLREREQCLEQFRVGWRTGNLQTVAELGAISERAGLRLVEALDLTSYLHLQRPRDRVIKLVVGATGVPWVRDRMIQKPFWANMIGGSALQTGLLRRWLEYRLLVLERG